jgi:hypothetical protein
MQFLIRERMRGMPAPNAIKSRGALLLELARELRDLREELEERRYGKSKLQYYLLIGFLKKQLKIAFIINNALESSKVLFVISIFRS